ncbi:MAG: ribonuclease P protein component [Byssovorax sp.]
MPVPGLGFGRARRIRKRAEFLRIQESSARVSTRHLLILLAARLLPEGESAARLGVVASKKTGNAVVRNRCKRLVREAFRRHPGLFPPRIDVVVVVRPGTHELSQAALDREILEVRALIQRRADGVLRAPPPAKPDSPG